MFLTGNNSNSFIIQFNEYKMNLTKNEIDLFFQNSLNLPTTETPKGFGTLSGLIQTATHFKPYLRFPTFVETLHPASYYLIDLIHF